MKDEGRSSHQDLRYVMMVREAEVRRGDDQEGGKVSG